MIQTPYAGASPTTPADLVEGITQIVNQATKSNKRDETAKEMMKNIKIFDGSNKAVQGYTCRYTYNQLQVRPDNGKHR